MVIKITVADDDDTTHDERELTTMAHTVRQLSEELGVPMASVVSFAVLSGVQLFAVESARSAIRELKKTLKERRGL